MATRSHRAGRYWNPYSHSDPLSPVAAEEKVRAKELELHLKLTKESEKLKNRRKILSCGPQKKSLASLINKKVGRKQKRRAWRSAIIDSLRDILSKKDIRLFTDIAEELNKRCLLDFNGKKFTEKSVRILVREEAQAQHKI